MFFIIIALIAGVYVVYGEHAHAREQDDDEIMLIQTRRAEVEEAPKTIMRAVRDMNNEHWLHQRDELTDIRGLATPVEMDQICKDDPRSSDADWLTRCQNFEVED